jgi:putative Mg2+ transporter-C (MgtC) family protein
MDAANLGFGEIALRLGLALLCGAVIGLNRQLHHRAAGLRTFGLVALATCGLTVSALASLGPSLDNVGRIVQGIVSGIGFLGAGVILHRPDKNLVTGLTTAAAVWFIAGISVLCGLGRYSLVALLLVFAIFLLLVGKPIEKLFEQWFGVPPDDDEEHEVR